MKSTKTKIAAGTTIATMGAVGAVAMSGAAGPPASTAAPSVAASAPVEVRTVVIKQTVRRTKRIKARPPSAGSPTAVAPAAPRAAPSMNGSESVVPMSATASVDDAAQLGTAQTVAYIARRKPPRKLRSRTSGAGRRKTRGRASALPSGNQNDRHETEETRDD